MKLTSIIISYNEADYLRKAIDSVLNQTLDDKEIIIGDDGSSDESQRIIQEYSAKYPEIIRTFTMDRANV